MYYKFYEKRTFKSIFLTLAISISIYFISYGITILISNTTFGMNILSTITLFSLMDIEVKYLVGVFPAVLLYPLIFFELVKLIPKYNKEMKAGLIPHYNGETIYDPESKAWKDLDIEWRSPKEWYGKLKIVGVANNLIEFVNLNKSQTNIIKMDEMDFLSCVEHIKGNRLNGYFIGRKIGKFYTIYMARPYKKKKISKY